MKNIFVYIAAIVLFTGCTKMESTQVKEIQEAFPNCEIRKIPNESGRDQWLVKTPTDKIIYIYFDGTQKIVSIPMY
jgi:hypothetical protein